MCHKLPGPRCAHHLRGHMATVRNQIAENRAAFAAGQEPPHQGAEGRLAQLRDEYDETRTGQAELAAELNRLENDDQPDVWKIEDIRSRMLNAADRRAAKLAALRSSEAGDHRAAKFQTRYGAHAGWLAHTDLATETKDQGGPTVYRDYAVGIASQDIHDETVGYEEQQRNILVCDTVQIYEAPVQPGPRPGTWMVGSLASRKNFGPRLVSSLAAYGPNQGHRDVLPRLYDEATGLVHGYDPASGNLHDSTPVNSPEGMAMLDYNNGFDLPEDTAVHVNEAKVAVVETNDGTPILRGVFDTTIQR